MEKTWTKKTAMPSMRPVITVVDMATAGHIESASLKIGFWLRMPLARSDDLESVLLMENPLELTYIGCFEIYFECSSVN